MKVRGISYAGCGFKGTYHFGATAALKDHLGWGSSPLPTILLIIFEYLKPIHFKRFQ